MKTPIVQLQNINKKYGEKMALENLNLSLLSHCVTGILGPNGSGKSTLFRLIVGMIQPNMGEVEVMGQSPGWRTNHQIAYLPDRARWYGGYTVKSSFDWAERLLPAFDRSRAEDLAATMDLTFNMPVSGMSRGQEARLMLILCLARDVPLIILDEPFSGIDLISRERIIAALIEVIAERDQTLILSTHEIYEAEALFDQVVFLDHGCVTLQGDTDTMREEHGSMENIYRKIYR